jgi:thiamine-monophosphate kinase
MKSGARAGDVVAVTGPLGLAAAGFEVLFNNLEIDPNSKEILLNHALNPEARSKEGILIAEKGYATSATDITDGLAKEIGELIDANSGAIGITIYENLLPVPDELLEVAYNIDKNPLDWILHYGEDFELLLTIDKDSFNKIKDLIPLYEIGNVTSSGKMIIVSKDGVERILEPRGYEHLSPTKNLD